MNHTKGNFVATFSLWVVNYDCSMFIRLFVKHAFLQPSITICNRIATLFQPAIIIWNHKYQYGQSKTITFTNREQTLMLFLCPRIMLENQHCTKKYPKNIHFRFCWSPVWLVWIQLQHIILFGLIQSSQTEGLPEQWYTFPLYSQSLREWSLEYFYLWDYNLTSNLVLATNSQTASILTLLTKEIGVCHSS